MPKSRGVLRCLPSENCASALRYVEWMRQRLAGPALAASLDGRFDSDVLWAALGTVEQETRKLVDLYSKEAA